jgi:hypothetical protein
MFCGQHRDTFRLTRVRGVRTFAVQIAKWALPLILEPLPADAARGVCHYTIAFPPERTRHWTAPSREGAAIGCPASAAGQLFEVDCFRTFLGTYPGFGSLPTSNFSPIQSRFQ